MIREFKIDTDYPYSVFCVVGNAKEMLALIAKKWKLEIEMENNWCALTFEVPGGVCVWLRSFSGHPSKQASLVHEISHIMDFICAFADMPFSCDTREPRAYLSERIFTEFNEKWKNARNARH